MKKLRTLALVIFAGFILTSCNTWQRTNIQTVQAKPSSASCQWLYLLNKIRTELGWARGQGFEPQFPRSERGVLPLDDPRILKFYNKIKDFSIKGLLPNRLSSRNLHISGEAKQKL